MKSSPELITVYQKIDTVSKFSISPNQWSVRRYLKKQFVIGSLAIYRICPPLLGGMDTQNLLTSENLAAFLAALEKTWQGRATHTTERVVFT